MAKLACIILAGGRSSRFKEHTNIDKYRFEIDGIPLIERLIGEISKLECDIFLSVRSRIQSDEISYFLSERDSIIPRIIIDNRLDIQGPMAGIISSFFQIDADYFLFVPVDYPWLKSQDLDLLVNTITETGSQICSYWTKEGHITTSLFISKDLDLDILLEAPPKVKARISSLFRFVNTTTLLKTIVSENQFVNLNTPQDSLSQITRVSDFEEITIESGNAFSKFITHSKRGERDLSRASLDQELNIWDGTYFTDHIERDIEAMTD